MAERKPSWGDLYDEAKLAPHLAKLISGRKIDPELAKAVRDLKEGIVSDILYLHGEAQKQRGLEPDPAVETKVKNTGRLFELLLLSTASPKKAKRKPKHTRKKASN